jgi:methylthioribulose-1-phosphate dehydratase
VANANTRALASGLSKAMASIHRRGWCDGTGGNFSCVLEHDPLRLLMAPSGVDKGSVAPRDLIEVNAAGEVVAGRGKASAETALHLEIVHTCGAGAVLHTHSQAGTLLSQWALEHSGSGTPEPGASLELRDLEMLKGLEGITTHDCSVQLPVLANDQDLPGLSLRCRPRLAGAPHGVLIAGHGLYAWGRNLGTALRHLEILEFLLEQRWRRLLLDALMQTPRKA